MLVACSTFIYFIVRVLGQVSTEFLLGASFYSFPPVGALGGFLLLLLTRDMFGLKKDVWRRLIILWGGLLGLAAAFPFHIEVTSGGTFDPSPLNIKDSLFALLPLYLIWQTGMLLVFHRRIMKTKEQAAVPAAPPPAPVEGGQ